MGINASNVENLLNETNKLLSDVSFENLIIMGNIVLKDSFNAKAWSDFDDFLLKIEKDAAIIGNKRFWNDVKVKSTAIIKSNRINDHIFSEFVTLNTNQQFPRKYSNQLKVCKHCLLDFKLPKLKRQIFYLYIIKLSATKKAIIHFLKNIHLLFSLYNKIKK